MKLQSKSACSTSTNTGGVVWVWNGLKIEDKASGRQALLGRKPQSKLYLYAVNFENFQHPEPYHLSWQHVVRNNSVWIIFVYLTGENCSNKNGLGHIVCHRSWHIRGTGSFSFRWQVLSSAPTQRLFFLFKGVEAAHLKVKDSKRLKTVDEIAQCMTFGFLNLLHWQHIMLGSLPKQRKKSNLQHKCG